MQRKTTVCPYCGVGCVFDLVVEDGHARRIEYVRDHPVTEGALCPKGNAALDIVYHPERLRHPLLKEDGVFRRIGWDEALDIAASRLGAVREKHGADALGFLTSAKCTNEENYLAQKLARLLGTNNVDHCARLCHASTVSGLSLTLGAGAMTNPLNDLANSDCLLVIGSNFPENHPVASRWALDAKDGGATTILVDPRRTPVAWSADLHLQLKPGSDVALVNAMLHVVFDEGLEDTEFLAARTLGVEALAESVRDVDLAEAERLTGVPVADIRKAARAYATAKAAGIVWSMGITQHAHGTDNVACLSNLALVTGNIGRPGAGLFPLRGQSNVQGACDMGCLASLLPGYVKVTDDEGRQRIARAWGREDLPPENGLTIVELTHAAYEGGVRALFIMGENPVVSDPNTAHVLASMEKLDFLVVQDIFMTETAELADLVLPAASFAERPGTMTATERRVQWQPKAIEPQGEARPDWQILCDLGTRLGLADQFAFDSPEAILREINAVVPQYAGITPERVSRPGGIVWPCPDPSHEGTPILHTESFKMPDGKGQLLPITYRPPAEPTDATWPLTLTTGRVVLHYNSGSMTRRTKSLDSREPDLFVEVNPADARSRGLKADEWAVVSSRRGETRAKVIVTEKVAAGVVFMPFHFPGTNALTLEDLDPIAKIPELKAAACQIRRE